MSDAEAFIQKVEEDITFPTEDEEAEQSEEEDPSNALLSTGHVTSKHT